MKKILDAQKILREQKIDGWLLYDFDGMNSLARRFLEISSMTTRRFFYWIPSRGDPVKIVHAIEQGALDAFPGEKKIYHSWQLLEGHIGSLLAGKEKIAMEYSPRNMVPYASKVDGGTLDLIRRAGVEVVSSASFLPHFTAVLTAEQAASHQEAARALDEIAGEIWKWIGREMNEGKKISEYDVQQKILAFFEKRDLHTESPPIAAVNAHSADPHYSPSKEKPVILQRGDFVLIDLWCKKKGACSVYGDITRVAALGPPTPKQQKIFQIVRSAQKEAVKLIKNRFLKGEPVYGYEADDASRQVIEREGFGKYFIHRTGHNIEIDLHGSGAHLDNLEMHDARPLLAGTCFSVEPGIYLPGEFGVRLEHDIYIHPDGKVEVTGGEQEEIFLITC